ncbi:hypothetical protein [Actinokineospora iranica]|uniref:Proteins of 100 residues with WXG n=1 Tax=Actinokineospora iranica TaxID=1271860 RepID=A0A1G6U939_9PSEU|nr:hypothetical protein [Actinokineospora iranica]SDD37065.1 hypothetical protein SAMN05216174_110137 [Actinokineospora iranica]
MTTAYSPASYGEWQDITPIQPAEITSEKKSLADEVQGKHPALDTVDFVWTNIIGPMIGKPESLYDLLFKPIAGDFNRIRANGTAFEDAGKMYWDIAGNLGKNAATLTTEHWTGDAATSFNNFVQVVATGALYIAKTCCDWLKKGFDKLADVSIQIANTCANLLNTVIEKLVKLAAKVIPGFGTLWSIAEWVISGFEDFPYISDAEAIVEGIQSIITLFENLESLVQSANAYWDAFKSVTEAVGQIPDINNTHDAVDTGKQISQSISDMKAAREAIDQKTGEITKQLSDMDSKAPPK